MEKEFWRSLRAKGLIVVGIAVWAEGDPLKKAKEFVQKHKVTYPVTYDPNQESKVANAYGVEGLPTNIVIGRDGRVRDWQFGFDAKRLRKAIEAALKEPAPKGQRKGK